MSSTTTPPTVFVTAATGTQGESVARQLRQVGWTVRATARNLDSPAAQTLKALGVDIRAGDWDDAASLQAAIHGCSMLFLNLLPAFDDILRERARARSLLDAARDAGVRHVIYSTGMGIDKFEQLPHLEAETFVGAAFRSKHDIENMVRGGGFEFWTMLRPGNFMANYLQPKVAMFNRGLAETGVWTTALTPTTLMPMVDTDDIGKFALAAFRDPARFHAQEIPIATEQLSPDAIIEHLAAASGKPLKIKYLTDEEVEVERVKNLFVQGQLVSRYISKLTTEDSIKRIKAWAVPLGTFADYLKARKDLVDETFAAV